MARAHSPVNGYKYSTGGEFRTHHTEHDYTYVVGHILSTSMQQGTREVTVRHLQAVVDGPERRREGIADPREASTGRRVRLKHQERLSPCLRHHRRVQIVRDKTLTVLVREVRWEHLERVLWRVIGIWEDYGAVVARVAARHERVSKRDRKHESLKWHSLFNGECGQILIVRLYEASVPHGLWPGSPVRSLHTGGDERLLVRHQGIALVRLREQREFSEVVEL